MNPVPTPPANTSTPVDEAPDEQRAERRRPVAGARRVAADHDLDLESVLDLAPVSRALPGGTWLPSRLAITPSSPWATVASTRAAPSPTRWRRHDPVRARLDDVGEQPPPVLVGQVDRVVAVDDELRALGFADAPALLKNWDANFSLGGPIKRDRIWFFANTRTTGNYGDTQNQYANKNAGNASAWTWARDESVRVRNDTSRWVNAIRLTSQVTPRNKVGFYFDYTMNCSGSSFVKDSGRVPQPGRRLDGLRSRASAPAWRRRRPSRARSGTPR